MRPFALITVVLLLLTSCKSETKEPETTVEIPALTIAEKIAQAHGIENWKNVSEIQFTFAVDRDTIKGNGRAWTWRPKTGDVSMRSGDRNFDYNRSAMDSTLIPVDQAFINDKYWLLVPFQLVWDTSATISEAKTAEAPISKAQLNMITITYSDEGGYTPGDAYDIYFDESYLIREWTFRKGNAPEPSLTTTFENHQDFNGIKIAVDHKKDDGNWNLNFTNVKVILD
ncbi:MAG: hypothetical protein AAF901_02805 [Bacteroidota bacterium]